MVKELYGVYRGIDMLRDRIKQWFDNRHFYWQLSLLLLAFIPAAIAVELFWLIYFALPTALQLLTAMLALYGFSIFTYYALRMYDDLWVYLVLGSFYAQAIPAAGIYPDVTRWLPSVMVIAALGLILPEFLRDVWSGMHRRLA